MKNKIWFPVLVILAIIMIGLQSQTMGRKSLANLDVKKPAPNFTLTDIHGDKHTLSDYKGKYVILEWTNYDCPYVKKHYNSMNMQNLQKEMTAKEVVWLSICSSGKGKQGNFKSAVWEKRVSENKAVPSAILLDPDGTVGRQYGAKTTPHMYIIDTKGILIYQGAIDNKPTTDAEDVKTSQNYVEQAMNQALSGQSVQTPQTKPYGCSVKYK